MSTAHGMSQAKLLGGTAHHSIIAAILSAQGCSAGDALYLYD